MSKIVHCPACGARLGTTECVTHRRCSCAPQTGDLSVCAGCGVASVFMPGGQLSVVNDAALSGPELRAVQTARRQTRKMN